MTSTYSPSANNKVKFQFEAQELFYQINSQDPDLLNAFSFLCIYFYIWF